MCNNIYWYSIYMEWICNFIGLIDLYTNFICVILCNKMFQDNYQKLCSCLDKQCVKCCKYIADNKPGENLTHTQIAIELNRMSNRSAT